MSIIAVHAALEGYVKICKNNILILRVSASMLCSVSLSMLHNLCSMSLSMLHNLCQVVLCQWNQNIVQFSSNRFHKYHLDKSEQWNFYQLNSIVVKQDSTSVFSGYPILKLTSPSCLHQWTLVTSRLIFTSLLKPRIIHLWDYLFSSAVPISLTFSFIVTHY